MKILMILSLLLIWSEQAIAICNSAIPATTPTSRFVVDSAKGTVLDTKTGLMWKQCPEGLSGAGCATGTTGLYTWQQALTQVQTVNAAGFAGYSDWRLPNLKELLSTVERQCFNPAINLQVFPNTLGYINSGFWSSSPCPLKNTTNISAFIMDLYFAEGRCAITAPTTKLFIRLVRGGQ